MRSITDAPRAAMCNCRPKAVTSGFQTTRTSSSANGCVAETSGAATASATAAAAEGEVAPRRDRPIWLPVARTASHPSADSRSDPSTSAATDSTDSAVVTRAAVIAGGSTGDDTARCTGDTETVSATDGAVTTGCRTGWPDAIAMDTAGFPTGASATRTLVVTPGTDGVTGRRSRCSGVSRRSETFGDALRASRPSRARCPGTPDADGP